MPTTRMLSAHAADDEASLPCLPPLRVLTLLDGALPSASAFSFSCRCCSRRCLLDSLREEGARAGDQVKRVEEEKSMEDDMRNGVVNFCGKR